MNTPADDTIMLVTDSASMHVRLKTAFLKSARNFHLNVLNSREAIEAFATPELILLDLMLACEPPLDILRWMRAQPRYEKTPVIAFGSGPMSAKYAEKAYELGVNSCLAELARQSVDQIAQGIAAYANLLKGSRPTGNRLH